MKLEFLQQIFEKHTNVKIQENSSIGSLVLGFGCVVSDAGDSLWREFWSLVLQVWGFDVPLETWISSTYFRKTHKCQNSRKFIHWEPSVSVRA